MFVFQSPRMVHIQVGDAAAPLFLNVDFEIKKIFLEIWFLFISRGEEQLFTFF